MLMNRRVVLACLSVAGLCLLFYTCTPNARSVVGTYAPNDNDDSSRLVIKEDGSFTQLDFGREVGTGQWKIDSAYHIFKSIELDGCFRLSLDDRDGLGKRRVGSYGLVHQGGKVCIDVDQVLLVWCKVS